MQKLLEVVEPARARRSVVTLTRPSEPLRDSVSRILISPLNIALDIHGGNFDADIVFTPPPS